MEGFQFPPPIGATVPFIFAVSRLLSPYLPRLNRWFWLCDVFSNVSIEIVRDLANEFEQAFTFLKKITNVSVLSQGGIQEYALKGPVFDVICKGPNLDYIFLNSNVKCSC